MLPKGKIKTASFKGGVKKPNVQVGSIDKDKTFQARVVGTGGRNKQAGMLLDGIMSDGDTLYGSSTYDAYNNSYVTGANNNYNDIPIFFQMMNEQNGGYIQLPVTLREKYQWYRYFFRTEAYVSRSLELLADLPMSKITLNMPKMDGKEDLRNEILEFFKYHVEHIGLFQILQSSLLEYNMIGNVFLFHEWDEEKKMWDKIVMRPP